MSERVAEYIVKDHQRNQYFFNPFPGLRPFGFEESHLFFGREGQSDEVLVKLAENHFIAVIGTSGSGKSSLMQCGLLPVLYGGFMTKAGSEWIVIGSRPGISPIENLAEAIFQKDEHAKLFDDSKKRIHRTAISSILRSSSLGLADTLKRFTTGGHQNVLIMIDQFEELFRFIKDQNEPDAINEAFAFVNLLLKAIYQSEVPIYVSVTMRSDFIGESAQFPGLTNLINKSQYLIPQMTREQQKLAIEGPVAVGGGKITKRLVQQVLNDIGNNQDKLPLMQHALMRTWEYWIRNREEGEAMDLRHYNAVGRLSQALSQHADETYNELSKKEKEICEVLFKSLTEKAREDFGIRRPTPLNLISEIAMVTEDEVITVIEKFRQPGRSLLMPPSGTILESNSMIEISHESLMRIWGRLRNWTEEEAESARMYKRLSEAAELYHVGRTGLWRPPDLQLALNWRKKQNPSWAWAQRYNPLFERAMVFLETSQTVYEEDQKIQEKLQQKLLQRAKAVALVLGVAAVISIVFFVFAIMKKIDAEEQAELARNNEIKALEQTQLAELSKITAQKEAAKARNQERLALEARAEAMENFQLARKQRVIAEERTAFAENQKLIADEEKVNAKKAQIFAEEQRDLANTRRIEAYKLRLLSIAQSMAVKSLQERSEDRKGLLSLQAYNFHLQYGGDPFDNYIYDGLYYSLRQMEDENFYIMNGHKDIIRELTFSNDGIFVYSTGSDGKILKWNLKNYKDSPLVVFQNGYVNRALAISNDSKWLINAGNNSKVQAFDLTSENPKPIQIDGHQGIIYDIVFLNNNKNFITTGSDSTIRMNDMSGGTILRKCETVFKSLALDPDGTKLAGVDDNGRLYLWYGTGLNQEKVLLDQNDNPLHTVSFDPTGRYLAVGDEQGRVLMFNLESKTNGQLEEQIVLTGHQSRVNALKFSSDGKYLATAGFDFKIQLWNMDDLDKLPIILRDYNSYVWTLDFSPGGNYLLGGSGDGNIKIWPTNIDILANQICEKLNRNFTQKEWERYVAPDIPYEVTCPDLIVEN